MPAETRSGPEPLAALRVSADTVLARWRHSLSRHRALINASAGVANGVNLCDLGGQVLWSSTDTDSASSESTAAHASSAVELPVMHAGKAIAYLRLTGDSTAAEVGRDVESESDPDSVHKPAELLSHWHEHVEHDVLRRLLSSERSRRLARVRRSLDTAGDIEQAILQYQASGGQQVIDRLLHHVSRSMGYAPVCLYWRITDQLNIVTAGISDEGSNEKLRRYLRQTLWPEWSRSRPDDVLPHYRAWKPTLDDPSQEESATGPLDQLLLLPLYNTRKLLSGVMVVRLPGSEVENRAEHWMATGEQLSRLVRRQLVSDLDTGTGLLNRATFSLQAQRWQVREGVEGDVGCLLSLQFTIARQVEQDCGTTAARIAFADALALLQTRLRSRDISGRCGENVVCVLLKQCTEEDADRVVRNLRERLDGYRFRWEGRSYTAGVTMTLHPLDANSGIEQLIDQARENERQDGQVPAPKVFAERTRAANDSRRKTGDKSALQPGSGSVIQADARFSRRLQTPEQTRDAVRLLHAHGTEALHPEAERLVGVAAAASVRLKPLAVLNNELPVAGYLTRSMCHHSQGRPLEWEVVLENLGMQSTDTRDQTPTMFVISMPGTEINEASVSWLENQCHEQRVAPSSLCIAVSEASIGARLPTAMPALRRLDRLGFRLMLDTAADSPNAYLLMRQLSFSFVRPAPALAVQAANDRFQLALLTAQVQVAHSIGASVVCGGLDSGELLSLCRSVGVDLGYGRECGPSVSLKSAMEAGLPSA